MIRSSYPSGGFRLVDGADHGVSRSRAASLWNDEDRLQILTETFAPGACVAEVARRHDESTALVYTWRRKLCEAHAEPPLDELAAPGFAAAVMIEDAEAGHPRMQPVIIIDLAGGKRISIFASALPALVASALKALR